MTKSASWSGPGGLEDLLDSVASSNAPDEVNILPADRPRATNRMYMEVYEALQETVKVQRRGRVEFMRTSQIISRQLCEAARKREPDAISRIERWASLIRKFEELSPSSAKGPILVMFTGDASETEPHWKTWEELNQLLDTGVLEWGDPARRNELLPPNKRHSAGQMLIELHWALTEEVVVRKNGHIEKMPTSVKMIAHQLSDAARKNEGKRFWTKWSVGSLLSKK